MNDHHQDPLIIAEKRFSSRLILGTGKFPSYAKMAAALDASGCEIVTVALRRVDLTTPGKDILDFIDRTKYHLLPNTSGARTADEAVRLAKLSRAAGLSHWVKLEVVPDPRFLLPDPVGTLEAAKVLVKAGFVVLPYINADPVLAMKLTDAGTATVMPLAAPIGTNRGLKTRGNLEIIIEQARVPIVVDAGLGAPSHAAEAMEMGADAVLVNTAIAVANDPAAMARSFSLGVQAGRMALRSGLGASRFEAEASSPLTGFLR